MDEGDRWLGLEEGLTLFPPSSFWSISTHLSGPVDRKEGLNPDYGRIRSIRLASAFTLFSLVLSTGKGGSTS